MILFVCVCFLAPGDDALLDEVDEPVAEELGVNAELAMVAQQREHRIRDRADAGLQRRAVGESRSAMNAAIRRSISDVSPGGISTIGVSPSHQPITWLHVDLVLAEGARHARIHLDEERELADERGDVLGVTAEGEVAVPVGRAPPRRRRAPASSERIRCGTSLKLFGTRSQVPAWNAARFAGERNHETWRRPGNAPSM